jgi:hypothetical protein
MSNLSSNNSKNNNNNDNLNNNNNVSSNSNKNASKKTLTDAELVADLQTLKAASDTLKVSLFFDWGVFGGRVANSLGGFRDFLVFFSFFVICSL